MAGRKATETVESTVEVLRAAVQAERDKLDSVRLGISDAAAELEAMKAQSSQVVLDAPGKAVALAGQIGQREAYLGMLRAAVPDQEARVREAERAFLLAESDLRRPALEEARQALAAHETKTAELLSALVEHEGQYVPEWQYKRALWDALPDGGMHLPVDERSYSSPRSFLFEEAVSEAEVPVLILEAMAQGVDPERVPALAGRLDDGRYPECVWGPHAVVSAPRFLRVLGAAVENVEAARASLSQVDLAIADLEADEAAGVPDIADPTLGASRSARSERAFAQRRALEERLEAGQKALEALSGTGAPDGC